MSKFINQTELRIEYNMKNGEHPMHEEAAFHEGRQFKQEYVLWLEEEVIRLRKRMETINLPHQMRT